MLRAAMVLKMQENKPSLKLRWYILAILVILIIFLIIRSFGFCAPNCFKTVVCNKHLLLRINLSKLFFPGTKRSTLSHVPFTAASVMQWVPSRYLDLESGTSLSQIKIYDQIKCSILPFLNCSVVLQHFRDQLEMSDCVAGFQTTRPYTQAWEENSPSDWSLAMPGTSHIFSCSIFDWLQLLQTCFERFPNVDKLTIHGVREHGHERPHQCNYCGQRFAAKQTFQKHLKIHSSERPYR